MKQRYTRLKLRLLLTVIFVALGCTLLSWLLLELLVDGPLQQPATHAVAWLAQFLFGHSDTAALTLYDTYVRQHKALYIVAATLVMTLIAFYLSLGSFTRQLNQIALGMRLVAAESNQPGQLPRELAPLQTELRALQATLQWRQEQARQAEVRKSDLLVFLAHDLKTPLTSVIGYLTLLRNDPALTVEQRAKYTGIALDKALRLEDLMLEFFEIARDGLHAAPAQPTPIQLSLLLEQMADEFMPQLQEKSLTCRTDISDGLWVCGDADKLARVFDNVLRNAVNYSISGGVVELEAAARAEQVVITIRNEGLEIPEQELIHIFEKFYRLDAARSTRTGGAGLGLAIAKEIVEAHGGTIHAESNGRSTAFVIVLPAYLAEQAPHTPAE